MVKPGDICLVLSAGPGDPDAGKVVTAIERATLDELSAALRIPKIVPRVPRPLWRVDRPITWGFSDRKALAPYCPESLLMPLRDPDADVSETQDRTVTA